MLADEGIDSLPLAFDNADFVHDLAGWKVEDFGVAGAWIEPDHGHAVFALEGDAAVVMLGSTGCVDLDALLQSSGLPHGKHEYRIVVRYRVLQGNGQLRARVRTGFAGDTDADSGACIGPQTGAIASYATVGVDSTFRDHDSGWMTLASAPLAMADIAFARDSSTPLLAELDAISVWLRTVPVIFGGDGFETPAQVSAGSRW